MIFGNDILQRKLQVSEEGTTDENGDYTPPASPWGDEEQCDAVPNGKSEARSFNGGEARVYTYTVELDPETKPFAIGEHVLLSVKGQKPQEYAVLGYHPYSTVAKVWV